MFIPISKIQELIDVCKEIDAKYSEDEDELANKRIHVRDIAGTLQKLIDDELDALDKMSKEFVSWEQTKMDEAAAAANEMMEAGAAVMDWAQQEKLMDDETRKMQDWPGGV